MALNFPNNPTVGQQYIYPPFIYQWDGSKWVTVSSPTSAADELREDLSADTGATLVGTSTGQTVQYELDNHTHTPAEVGALPVGGTAVAASKLAAARSIALTGDVTGSTSFDGSTNVSITTAYKNSGVTAGTYKSVTVDAKGNITAGTNPTTLAGYGITDAQASDATLTAMAGVVTAADRIIYFNGVDTALATPLTAFGRTLIDDADAATARATIGAAATSHTHVIADVTNLQTSLDGKLDTTATAAAATKLATARTISLAGDATGSVSFDGTANVSITAVVVDDSHNHIIGNVDNLQSTLDGKAPGGYGLGGYCASISGDLTTVLRTNCGFYNADAAGVTNEFNSSGWCYYLNMAHGNAAGYNGTIAIQFNGATMGFRTVEGGVNKGWKTLIHNAWSGTFSVTGTNNDYTGGGVMLNGNGATNTVYPTLGFHQPSLFAGSLQQRDASTFAFYKQGGSAYANLNINDVYIASDRRLKSDFATLENALNKICNLTGQTYIKNGVREAGIIAQDLKEVLPEAVHENDQGYLSIASAGVNALLVEAIKELVAKIELQQHEINTLKLHVGNK